MAQICRYATFGFLPLVPDFMKKMIAVLLCLFAVCAPAFSQYDEEETPQYHEGMAAVKRGDLYGFADESGDLVIAPQYELVSRFSEGVCAVKKDGKVGYIDKTGAVVIPLMYDGAFNFHNGITLVQLDGKNGLVNKKNAVVLPIKYDYIDPPMPDFHFIRAGMLEPVKSLGLYDARGRELVPPQYEYIDIRAGSAVAMVQKDGKWGLVNRQGKLLVPCRYDGINCGEGLCEVKMNDLWGCMDTLGKMILPAEYKHVSVLENNGGIIAKQPQGKSAFFDTKGKIIIGWKYEDLQEDDGMIEGTAADGTIALLDKSGKVLVPEGQYDAIWYPKGSRDYLMTRRGDLYGFLSAGFKVTLAPVFDEVEEPDTDKDGDEARYYGMRLVKKNGRYGLVDPVRGITIVPALYDDISTFKEGLAVVKDGEKYGFINRSGIEVIPVRFSMACGFSEGVAAVTETDEGDFGFIDKEGKLLTGFRFPMLSQAFLDAAKEQSASTTLAELHAIDNLVEFKNGKAVYNLRPGGDADVIYLEDVQSGRYK